MKQSVPIPYDNDDNDDDDDEDDSKAPETTNTLFQLASLQAPELLPQTRPTPSPTLTLEKSQANIFYLAYGSNLCSATFLGQRKIRPISSTNVRVPSLSLTFNLPGIAYLEPCFANVSESPPNDEGWWKNGLIGVVYEVTPSDFVKIIATEGGGAAYKVHTVTALPICGGEPIVATTLLAPTSHTRDTRAQPSRRYLELIRLGARQHRLPAEYREWLEGLEVYRKTMWRQWVGAVVWGLMWWPGVVVVMVLGKVFSDREGRSPPWLMRLQSALWKAMWWVYDGGFKQVWGDGERTVECMEKSGGDGEVTCGWRRVGG